jgi:hypothetical protein
VELLLDKKINQCFVIIAKKELKDLKKLQELTMNKLRLFLFNLNFAIYHMIAYSKNPMNFEEWNERRQLKKMIRNMEKYND